MKQILLRLFLTIAIITPLNIQAVQIDYGSWGTITVYIDETVTLSEKFSSISSFSMSKVRGWEWSTSSFSSESVGFYSEITSQSNRTCVVKGRWNSKGYSDKIYCKVTYGSSNNINEYIAYYNVIVKSRGTITVSASPSSGTVAKGTKVTITPSVSGSTIYYTTDGSMPTTSSSVYSSSSGVIINKTTTLKARAVKSGYESEISTWNFTVKQPVEKITISPSTISLGINETKQLTATVTPSNATDKTVSWSSSNSSVASVSSSGLVTAKANGTATITCKANDGSGKQATCTVSVSSVKSYSNFTAKTKEGVEMRFYVGDISKGVCKVDYGYNNPAVDINTTGSITIPSEVEGLKVTEINGYAFYKCTGITSVSIPSSVETIGSRAFSDCTGLTSVSLGNGVKRLESYAFYGCSSLTSITGISQLEYIGSQAFNITYNSTYIPWYNSLPDGPLYLGKVLYKYKGTMPDNTTVDVKEGTTTIGYEAFSSKDGLVGINIPQSLKTIDSYAFEYCPNLTSIKVASGNNTFDSRNNCNAIVRTADNTIVAGCKGTTIPSTVTTIGSSAFYGSGLTELVIPSNVDSISYSAFNNSQSLTSIMIGSGLRAVVNNPFNRCTKLSSISVATANPYFDSRNNCNALIETKTNKLIAGCTTTVIPSTIKTIGESAFYDYDNGFYSVSIPDNVETIERYAFEYDYSLRSVTLGKDLKEIGKSAFYGCNALRTIHSKVSEPMEIDESVFRSNYTYYPDSIYNNATLYVPIGSKVNYMTTAGWNKFKKIVEIADNAEPEGLVFSEKNAEGYLLTYQVTSQQQKTCILLGASVDATGKVTIPNKAREYDVVAIDGYAFDDGVLMRNITDVSIPNSVKDIGIWAFDYCKITSFILPSTVTNVGWGILARNPVTSLAVEAGNPVYDSRNNCNAIIETATNKLVVGCATTKIPIGVKTLGTCSFYGTGLTTITIPATVDSIGSNVFMNCMSLVKVYSEIESPFDINPRVFSNYYDGDYHFTDATLYVPVGTKAKYQTTEGWNQFKNIVEYTPDDDPTITTKGDVNGDQLVNGTDLVALSNIVLGRREKVAAADVNGDGNVNGTDIVALSNIILGKTTAKAKAMSVVNANAGASLSIEPFSINAGEEKEMLIDLNNANDEVTLVQFDMQLPAGLSIKKVGGEYDFDIAGRTTWRKHTLDANETDGAVRFLMYSSSSTAIEGTSGAIISVKLVADASYSGGKIILANTLLVSPNEKETKPADYEYDLGGGSVTPDDGSAKLSIERFTINAGEEKEMLIDLNNANDEVTLVQFDMKLPAGLSIKKVGGEYDFDIAGRTTWRKHTLDANETDGAVRFLMYSSSSTAIEGTSGAIISVKLVADSSFRQEGSKIVLSNILLVSPNEKETKPADYTYSLDSTGIKVATVDEVQQTSIYSLSGQRLSTPKKGINIIGGKKVVVK